ncbi:phenylacetate--CoA ligase family protein [Desulfovibrio inopinatus]|uniref:phenylacetate--CoA ligase family protein n=1 Tax=Desulfovibrio inopinatus TaxID=102109 RepID=UPI0004174015|nr:phenylacetate--CoA ligase [Desulfovibrio inopinatus]
MYFDPKFETMSRGELSQLILERLQSTLNRVARNVPYYKTAFAERDIDPDDFYTLEDITRLPFTTRDVLMQGYPYDLFAVPLRDVVRLHTPSGSSDKPIVVGYTKNDLAKWSSLTARILVAGGVSRDDVVQIAFSYGLLTGGFGFHNGAELIGAAVIPSSNAPSSRQIMIMQDYKSTALICTPSHALRLAEQLENANININALPLRWGLFGGEPWSIAMRTEIEDRLKVTATDNYGISDVMGPGVAGECQHQCGMHINEDHFLAEVINPTTGEPVADGDVGELVLTTLTKEAFPVIRYRTGDLTRIIDEPCACGRTFRRIDKIQGRVDDVFVFRGINVYPSRITRILSEFENASHRFIVELEQHGARDEAALKVEMSEGFFFDQMRVQHEFVKRIEKRLHSELGVSFNVKLVEPKREEEDEPAYTVIDKRHIRH